MDLYGERGESVIAYILGDERSRKGIEKVEVGEKIESNHQPLIVWIRGKEKRGVRRKREDGEGHGQRKEKRNLEEH